MKMQSEVVEPGVAHPGRQSLSDLPVRVYAASGTGLGLIPSLRQAVDELFATREVIWRLFVRDFKAQFRQRLLGYVWAFISPLVGLASFLFLHYMGVLNPGGTGIPYPLYLYLGLTLWNVFMGAIHAVSGSLVVHGDLLLRTSVPKFALAVAGLAGYLYHQVVSLIVLGLALLLFKVAPSWWLLLYPMLAAPLFAFGLGIGLFLAGIGSIARDATSMIVTLLNFGMYVTPVIYVGRAPTPELQRLLDYNPLTYLIDVPRSLIVSGDSLNALAFAGASAVGLCALIVGIHGFYLIQDYVAERL